MRQAEQSGEKRAFRRWMLVFLCLGIVILLCSLVAVSCSTSWLPRKPDGDGVEAKNRNDISQLSEAVVNFETKYTVDYVPSRFVLCETLNDYNTGMSNPDPATAKLYSDSLSYLNRLWTRLNWGTVQAGPPSWPGIDWNGNGVQDPPVILEGDQCLVFFLGGIQSNKDSKLECLGISVNQTNPAREGGDRVGPFCEFKSSRLRAKPNGYFVYHDAYGTSPFAYFSSYKTRNGYNRYGTTDCNSIPDGPYHDGEGHYYNPESFQIISAGADGKFGRGGKWTPSNAKDIDPAGRDDMSNFHPTLLGNPK
jgi:general secretion pathway protein G